MGRLILSLAGALLLVAGLYLLYTVFIDTPDEQTETSGLRTTANTGAVQSENSDAEAEAEAMAQVDDQIAEIGGDPGTRNIIENNAVSGADRPVAVRPDAIIPTDGLQVDPNSSNAAGIDDLSGQGGSIVSIEQRLVELEYPESFRVGESGSVRLTYKPLSAGVSGAEIDTNTVQVSPINVQDCYDFYDAYVTAYFSSDDSFEVEAIDESETKRVERGQEVTWRWTVTPQKEGAYAMTFALKLDWRTKQGGVSIGGDCTAPQGNPTANTIWGKPVQTSVDYVIGLITIPQASLAGTVLAVVGTASQVPFLTNLLLVLMDRQVQKRTGGKRRSKKQQRRKR